MIKQLLELKGDITLGDFLAHILVSGIVGFSIGAVVFTIVSYH